MQSDNLVKICPTCFYANSAHARHCGRCAKSLAGIRGLSEPQVIFDELLPDEPSWKSEGATNPINSLPKEHPPVALNELQHVASSLESRTLTRPLLQNSIIKTPLKRRRILLTALAVMLLVLIILVTIPFSHLPFSPTKEPTATVVATLPPSLNGLGEFKASNGDLLGVNDGSLPPFIGGNDASLKQQAAAQLKQGNSGQAIALWQAALKRTSNDAEALIYLEDQRILLTGLPYITLVVGTDLSNSSGLSDLQGVYVAQHEFNYGNNGFQLRILIANSGADTYNVPTIAQQIVRLATQDKTVVGVISWLTSTENLGALPILAKAHIPIISPAASSDQLTDASPYFFRVVPPNQVQGNADALFAEQTLKAKKVVVFVDNQDSYSQNLAQDFENQFTKDGNTVLKEEPFTTDHTSQIGTLIQDALSMNPDLLYFTSRDTLDSANFQDALPTSGPFARLPALAGDAGYVIHKSGFGRWYFTAFAFADEWETVMGQQSQPLFYQEYSADFNPNSIKPLGYYGYTRPLDISILSYDVTSVFEDAFHIAITSGKVTVTPNGLNGLTSEVVDTALSHITGSQAWQGVSGQISFDANHNPANKAIVILSASSDGYTHMDGWEGCFAPGVCRTDSP